MLADNLRKNIFRGGLLAILLVLCFWFLFRNLFEVGVVSSKANNSVDSIEQVALSSSVTDSASKLSLSTVNQAAVNQPQSLMQSPSKNPEIENWFASRGYSDFATNEYKNYPEDALISLAKNGDVKAIRALGDIRFRQLGYEGALPLYLEAAARGSTDVIRQIGMMEEISHYQKALTYEDKRLYVQKTIAWYSLAALRGDRWPQVTFQNQFLTSNNIVLTEEDNQKIDEISQQLYKQLQDKRTELGLGVFDNSVPNSVGLYFDHMDMVNKKMKY